MVIKLLVSISNKAITIYNNGSKLVIASNTKLYNDLKDKSREEIIEWYKSRIIS